MTSWINFKSFSYSVTKQFDIFSGTSADVKLVQVLYYIGILLVQKSSLASSSACILRTLKSGFKTSRISENICMWSFSLHPKNDSSLNWCFAYGFRWCLKSFQPWMWPGHLSNHPLLRYKWLTEPYEQKFGIWHPMATIVSKTIFVSTWTNRGVFKAFFDFENVLDFSRIVSIRS